MIMQELLAVLWRHFSIFIPTAETAIRSALIGAFVFWLAGSFAGALRRRGFRTGDTRKIFHFCVFTSAACVRAFSSEGPAAVAAYGLTVFLGILASVYRGEGDLVFEALARPSDAPKRALHVVVPLIATALGGLFAHIIGGGAEIVAMLVGGWGDAVGEPVGIRWGKHRYAVKSLGGVPSTRSWEGTAAVLVASVCAGFLGFRLIGIDPASAIAMASIVALVATTVETFSPHGTDNFSVMAVAAITTRLLLG